MTKKIAVMSIKGGVGKTTTCINLAAYISAMGIKTLLVDLDPQNGVMFGMGLDPREVYGLKDIVLNNVHPDDALAPTNRSALRVMMTGHFANGDELENFMTAFDQDLYCVHKILETIINEGQFLPELILMDGPAGVGSLATNALVATNSIILPVQCEPLSLRTLPQMLRYAASVKTKYNPDLEVEGILATMYDTRQEAKLGIARQIWDEFPEDMVFETTIPKHEQLIESFTVGSPAVDLSARSVGSQAYIQLGRELIMRLPESEPFNKVVAAHI